MRNLAQLDQADAIQARCQGELALLEQGYPRQTVASRMLAPTVKPSARQSTIVNSRPRIGSTRFW